MTDARTPDDPRSAAGGTPGSDAGRSGSDGHSSGSPSLQKGESTPTGYGAPQYGTPEPRSEWQATAAGSYPAAGQSGSDTPSTGGYQGAPAYAAPSEPYGSSPYGNQDYGQGYGQGYGQPGQQGQPGQPGQPGQQYGGGYAPPPGGYGAPGGPGGTPPKKKRTGLIIGLVAAAVVVVLAVGIGLVVAFSGGGSDGGKPEETVRAYLQALADGKASEALAQGATPSDDTFVTDEALAAQRKIATITDISTSLSYDSSNSASVTATYRFGNRQANERYSLSRIAGEWKLDATTYSLTLSSLDDVPGLSVLGIEVGDRSEVELFPGPLTFASSNDYISVKNNDENEYALSPNDYGGSYVSLETGLTDDGEQAVADAVTTYLTTCAASKELTPDNCPQREYDYTAVDGTATWTLPSDLSGLEYQTSSTPTEVYVSGDLTWSVTFNADNGAGGVAPKTVDDVDGSLYGSVDLSQDPPVYSE